MNLEKQDRLVSRDEEVVPLVLLGGGIAFGGNAAGMVGQEMNRTIGQFRNEPLRLGRLVRPGLLVNSSVRHTRDTNETRTIPTMKKPAIFTPSGRSITLTASV